MSTLYSTVVCSGCSSTMPVGVQCQKCKPMTEARVREIAREEIAKWPTAKLVRSEVRPVPYIHDEYPAPKGQPAQASVPYAYGMEKPPMQVIEEQRTEIATLTHMVTLLRDGRSKADLEYKALHDRCAEAEKALDKELLERERLERIASAEHAVLCARALISELDKETTK